MADRDNLIGVTDNDKGSKKSSRAADVSRKVAKRGAKQFRKNLRRFNSLAIDTTKSLFGVGQRRVNRYSNRTVSGRYRNDVISFAETAHLAGLQIDLSRILVEPRFLEPPDLAEPIADDELVQEVFYVVPRVPDMPYITAPYNVRSYRIPQLAVGNRKIAILGPSGSGRTTALMAIALWVMQEVRFEEPDDVVKQRIAEEEEELSDRERKEKQRQREEMLAEAKAQLENAIEKGEIERAKAVNAAEAATEDAESEIELPAFNTLLPILFHCADLNITAREFGAEVDPAEPLVRAVQRRVNTLTARTIPGMIYERLERNGTLLLMDGYDELPAAEQRRVRAWLYAFMQQYGNNFLIMTGPVTGWGSLARLGMTPLYIKPWNPREVKDYVNKWASAWPEATRIRRRDGKEVDNNQVKRALSDNYALSPAELTLKILATYHSSNTEPYLDEWIEDFIKRRLPGNAKYDQILDLLKIAGTLQTDLGFITRLGIETLFQQQEESHHSGISAEALHKLDVDGDGVADAEEYDDAYDEDEDLDDDSEDEAANARRRLVRELQFTGLLLNYRGGRYRFRHKIIADYLASLSLTNLPDDDPASLFQIAQRSNWQNVLTMAAMHTNLDKVVEMRFEENPDILRGHLLDMMRWLAFCREEPVWREELLRRIGGAFLYPQLYSGTRERVGAAIVYSRDVAGAMNIFVRGLTHKEPDVRRIAALGIGAMGTNGRAYTHQVAELVDDPTEPVELAAAHALGALDNNDAKEIMIEALLSGTPMLQQAIAEAFAGMPEDGYPTLYDAVEHEDMGIRKAAIFGLRRIETEWAMDTIRHNFLHEDEWYVRVISQDEFLKSQAGLVGPEHNLTPDEIEWIQDWAADREIRMRMGMRSYATLAEALNDQHPDIRRNGALLLGQLGVVEAVKPLYGKLTDPEPDVRDAAHRALVDLQIAIGDELGDPT